MYGLTWQTGVMSHGQDHEHEHAHLEELHAAYLGARRSWRVGLRVHLESEPPLGHGRPVHGGEDPERVHRDVHEGD